MRHILNFILTTVMYWSVLCCLNAQREVGQGSGVIVKGTSIGSQAILKWVPENADFFQTARANGYKIVRYTLTNSSGQNLSYEVQTATKVTIANAVKPITIAKWDSITNGNHPYDSLMRFGYLSSAFDFQPSGTKMADAVDFKEKKKNAFIYASLVADSDINLAKYLGLAFTDATVSPGLKYKYFISINGVNATGNAIVEPMDISQLPVATQLETSYTDKKITITWNSSGLDEFYTYFDVYRSDNGGVSYIKANSDPFIYMADQENDSKVISFSDKVPANGVIYTYKIRGISPYGFDGPFSDTISAAALPSRLNLETSVTSIAFDPVGAALINWELLGKDSINGVTVNFESLIDRYDVLYRENLTDTALVINSQPIGNNVNQFTIPAPARQGLYFIRATDIYEYTYTSVPFLGQSLDTIPPAVPTNLAGTMTKDGRITLTWSQNSDNDLLGYKIYLAYGKVNPFTQITSTHIVGTEYKTVIKTDNANDTVYYKISAVDQRYNISALSQPVFLVLPDKAPPSDPVLKGVTVTKQGNRVAWSLSESSDLKKHILQRKFKTAVQWDNILDIPAGNVNYPPLPLQTGEIEQANYVDTVKLELREYDYRMMAIDSSDNQSISQVVTIIPFDDGIRGTINPFESRLVPLGAVYNPTTQPPVSGSNAVDTAPYDDITDLNDQGEINNLDPNAPRPNAPQKRAKSNIVRLEWRYETEFPSSVVAFQIYQKKASSTPGNISQAIPSNPPFVLVKTINVNDAGLIANMNNLNTYVTFIEDIPGMKVPTPAEYKIIAKHQDGGFSTPAFGTVTIPSNSF